MDSRIDSLLALGRQPSEALIGDSGPDAGIFGAPCRRMSASGRDSLLCRSADTAVSAALRLDPGSSAALEELFSD